jgi:translation initiation factor eIF-2B subunit beta
MAQGATVVTTPGLTSFLKSLKTTPADPSVEYLIA